MNCRPRLAGQALVQWLAVSALRPAGLGGVDTDEPPSSWQGISIHVPSGPCWREWHGEGADLSSVCWAFEFLASAGAVMMARAASEPRMALTVRI
jgi:hypothetical protein